WRRKRSDRRTRSRRPEPRIPETPTPRNALDFYSALPANRTFAFECLPEREATSGGRRQAGRETLVPALDTAFQPGRLRKFVPHAFHRRGALERSFARVRDENLQGDYFEFGIYRGSTFARAERLARRHLQQSGMRLFGFDSFQGLPSPTGSEGATGEFLEGDFACSLPEVRANLDRRGVDWSRIHLIEGWFDETLNDDLK